MSQYNGPLVANMRTVSAVSPVATREANDTLYPKVAAGDKGAIRQMIESNMPLVLTKVESYIGAYPDLSYLRDDLVGEGMLGLTEAVNRMAQDGPIDKPNPTGYICVWIMKMIGEVVDKESAGGAASA